MTARNFLWEVIQAYMDDPAHRYSPKPADLARETGISDQVLSKWKSRPRLPTPTQLIRFAQGTGLSYEDLLIAALKGKDYLPEAPTAEFVKALPQEILEKPEWREAWFKVMLEFDRMEAAYSRLIAHRDLAIADLLHGGDGLGGHLDIYSPDARPAGLEARRLIDARRALSREARGLGGPDRQDDLEASLSPADQKELADLRLGREQERVQQQQRERGRRKPAGEAETAPPDADTGA